MTFLPSKFTFKLIIINLFVFIGLLCLLELALRLAGIGYGSNPMLPSPVYHHVHPSEYRFVSYSQSNDFGGFEVYYDESGMVAPPYPVAERSAFQDTIVFLGDSFVEGLQVPFDSGFVARLQREFPQTKLLNFGTSGYAPSVYYLLVKNKILTLPAPPAAVFIVLYSNDIEDDQTYLKTAVFDPSGDLTRLNGAPQSPVIPLLRQSYLFRLLRSAQIRLRYMINHWHEDSKAVGGYIEQFADFEGTPSAFYTQKTIELLRENDIPVFLTAIPSKYCHVRRDYSTPSFPVKVQAWAESRNIPFIDLERPLRVWAQKHPGQSAFFEKDIHFNEKGHAFMAAQLRPYLTSILSKKDSVPPQ